MRIKTARFYQSVKMKNKERNSAVENDPRFHVKYELELHDGLLHILYEDDEVQLVPVTNVSEMIVHPDEVNSKEDQLWQSESKPKRKRGRPPKNSQKSTENKIAVPF